MRAIACISAWALALVSVSLVVPGDAGAQAQPDETAAVSKAVHAAIGWALTKDKDLLLASVAQDAEFFIFHPDSASTIVGFDAFKAMVEDVFMRPEFKATGYAIKDLRIHFARGGEVAWFSCFLDDFGEWQGKPTAWKNARWTGVLEKRDERWVHAQMHFSFAVD